MSTLRFPVALALGTGLSFCIFSLLHSLTRVHTDPVKAVAVEKVEFVRLHRELEIEKRKREKVERVKPEEAPKVPTVTVAPEKGVKLGLDVSAIASGLGAEFGSAGGEQIRGVPGGVDFGGGMSDRSALPLVRVEPEYPPQAARRGQQGWVQLRFTVTTGGTVSDVVVVRSSDSVFDRAATAAVKKWKYAPQMQSGKPVETPGVEVVLRFELEK